jgi:mono/diheme cytochrome c family protein
MKLFLLGVISTLAVLVGACLVAIHGGAYDVAADKGHAAVETWILGTTMINSVKLRAAGITSPGDLDSEHRTHDGFHLFDEMCVQCHGAPGKDPGEVGKGLSPEPPDLVKAVRRWNTAELFWILKHGIKATGMPAFGGTHTNEQLWNIVAFVRALPDLDIERYNALQHGTDHDHQPTDHHEHRHGDEH